MIPAWLHLLSLAFLLLGALCCLGIAVDVVRHKQHMAIMNVVWPVTALFGTLWVVPGSICAYGSLAPSMKKMATAAMEKHGGTMPNKKRDAVSRSWWRTARLHCGSGCMLGDIACGMAGVPRAPAFAVWFGWHWHLFGREDVRGLWILDYLFAYALGIVFQYFTIAPMRHLSFGKAALWAVGEGRYALAHRPGRSACTASWR